jgi:SNF2 family DNA or RNA helicase
MLRRRKDDIINGKKLIELPKRTVEVVSCLFDASERTFYESLENKMDEVLEKLLNQDKGNKYISVLLLLLRLRQGMQSIFVHFYRLPNGDI